MKIEKIDIYPENGLDAVELLMRTVVTMLALTVYVLIVPAIQGFPDALPPNLDIRLVLSMLLFCALMGVATQLAYIVGLVRGRVFFILDPWPGANEVLSLKNIARTWVFYVVMAIVLAPALDVLSGVPASSAFNALGFEKYLIIGAMFAGLELLAKDDEVSHLLSLQ